MGSSPPSPIVIWPSKTVARVQGRVARRVGVGATLVLLLSRELPAHAAPQAHAAYRTGVCGVGAGELWQETRWCNGVFADVLFGRERNADFGFGPHAEVSSAGFWDARWGGGVTALFPVTQDFPLVLSAGAYGHELDAVALGGSLFFGARSFNFHGTYNLAAGFVVSAYRDLGPQPATLVNLGLEIDGFLFVAPFLLAAGALR